MDLFGLFNKMSRLARGVRLAFVPLEVGVLPFYFRLALAFGPVTKSATFGSLAWQIVW